MLVYATVAACVIKELCSISTVTVLAIDHMIGYSSASGAATIAQPVQYSNDPCS